MKSAIFAFFNNCKRCKIQYMNVPADLKYTKDHEWVKIDGNEAVIGITDFAQGELGDIVFVEFDAEEDDELDKEETFGSVEAVKTVSDLFIPLSGKVIAVNEDIDSDPEIVNQDPYGKGWMIKIEISDEAEIEDLLSADDYKDLIG